MLRCLIGKEEVNTFENDKEYFKNLSDKGVLKCPTCGTKLLYCHGDIKEPYFKHSEDCDCIEKNIKEIGQGKYDTKTNEEHSRGLRILYNSLKEIEGITDLKLEKNIKETNQRADIYFVYNDKEFVIEFQCCSNNSNYMIRHDLYKKNKITDIWILGNDNYSDKESYLDITLKSIEKQILMNDYRLVYLNVEEEKLELINSNDLGILYGSGNQSLKTKFKCGEIKNINIEYLILDYDKDFDELMLYNMINLIFSKNETFKTTGTELIGINTGFRINIKYNKDIVNNKIEINKKIREFMLIQKDIELYFSSEEYKERKQQILDLNNENIKVLIERRIKGTSKINILILSKDDYFKCDMEIDCEKFDLYELKTKFDKLNDLCIRNNIIKLNYKIISNYIKDIKNDYVECICSLKNYYKFIYNSKVKEYDETLDIKFKSKYNFEDYLSIDLYKFNSNEIYTIKDYYDNCIYRVSKYDHIIEYIKNLNTKYENNINIKYSYNCDKITISGTTDNCYDIVSDTFDISDFKFDNYVSNFINCIVEYFEYSDNMIEYIYNILSKNNLNTKGITIENYENLTTSIELNNIFANNSSFCITFNENNKYETLNKVIMFHNIMKDVNAEFLYDLYLYYYNNINLNVELNNNILYIGDDIEVSINTDDTLVLKNKYSTKNIKIVNRNKLFNIITQNYLPDIIRESLYK